MRVDLAPTVHVPVVDASLFLVAGVETVSLCHRRKRANRARGRAVV